MALTATAQSALREPAWGEEIVPTLRKRLQDESNVLAKRISAASLSSADDHSLGLYQPAASPSRTPPAQYSYNQKPSAIPRPNLQQSRTAYDSPVRPSHSARNRTLSQPFALDEEPGLSTSSSRPTSPMANGQSTRIPVSRSRAGSVSQGLYSGNPSRIADDGTRRNGDANPSSHYTEESEHWPVEEGSQSQRSRSTVRLPRHKGSDIMSESAPFAAGGATWAPLDGGRRTSNDSDERPFEHWYRGDYARNGGVGELRVGRREEMLDIANYGHVHRKPSSRAALSNYSRSRSTSRGRETARMRQRAESVSAPAHDSFYMEEEEADMVLDERPPTDVDESDVEQEYANEVDPHPNGTVSSPSLLNSGQAASRDVSQQRIQQSISPTVSRIPTPTSSRKMSPPPRTPTPTKAMRASTETRASSTAPSTPQRLPRSQTQPQLQSASKQKNSPAAKRKAKSPAPQTSASKTKKAKTKPPSAMRNVVPRKEDDRRSIGQYPTPDGDNVVDAIPTWTQPVPPSGNWDDVVLPVVARKKGLESHYTPADGSPKPKQKRGSDVYEPAPGTFGYDPSKNRRNRTDGDTTADTIAEDIPMDDLSRKIEEAKEDTPPLVTEQPKPQPPPGVQIISIDRSRSRPSPPPSPPPFAHYTQTEQSKQEAVPQQIPPTSAEIEIPRIEPNDRNDEDQGAGCCKCVIM